MKILNSKILNALLLFTIITFLTGCKKDEPEIQTTVTDIEGNSYNLVTIGTQIWMKENLKTTKYNDGTSIPLVTDVTVWSNLSTPGYCWYNNDEASNKTIYGSLYNWYTVDTRKLCPQGWHVPTDADWTILTDFLTNNNYGYQSSGNDIAKSMSAPLAWTTNSTAGTVGNDQTSNNSSGFKALPGGHRSYNGVFYNIGDIGYWWSSSENDANLAYYRNMNYNNSIVTRGNSLSKLVGFSIRCIKN